MVLVAKSIPGFARKRERIGPPFCTPPGSPFRALTPNADPLMEPTWHRGEKLKILAVGQSLKFYA